MSRALETEDTGEEEEEVLERIRKGKYIPPRRVVHLGKLQSYTCICTPAVAHLQLYTCP